MLKNYFKTAIRSLLRNSLYSTINILGLSLGLACVMLIVLYVKDELSFDRFHAKADRIYRIVSEASSPDGKQTRRMAITGLFQGPHFAAKVPEIQSYVRVSGGYREIKTPTDIQPQGVTIVDSNFFTVFSFPLLRGNPKTALIQPNAVVITETIAKRQFGTDDVLGRIIQLKDNDQFAPYVVTGVTKDCPQNSSIQFDVVLPFHEDPKQKANAEGWFSFFLTTFVVLSPDANVKAVEAKAQQAYEADAAGAIKLVREKYGSQGDITAMYKLEPLSRMHLGEFGGEGMANLSTPVYSYILSGIALFILLIACMNFVNLTIARSLKRAKEIGIRKVVGSSRPQLVWQFLGESMLLTLGAFLVAIALVQLCLPVFNTLANKSLALSYLFDGKLVATFAALFLATGMLAGFYPALVLSGYDPVKTLYNRYIPAGRNYLQKGLVVIQFTLAAFAIISTAVIFSQFRFLTTKKLGYDDNNLLKTYKQNLTVGEAELLREELSQDPDILGVAPKDAGFSFTGATINGNTGTSFVYASIDEYYLPLLKIPIVAGRNFSRDYPTDTASSVLVNETFVKKAGWQHPIGQSIVFEGNHIFRVVGVVKDYHFEPLNTELKPQVFVMQQQNGIGDIYIRIRPKTETASMQYIQRTFHKLFPLNPFSLSFQKDTNLKNYEAEARWKQIVLFSAIIIIFISGVGLFGLSVLYAQRRVKEIGVRKVLGASVSSVVRILSKDFLLLIFHSLLLAIPCAWMAADKWLSNYPYRIRLNWELFTFPGILVVLIAVATLSFQSVKAAMANPVNSLRSE